MLKALIDSPLPHILLPIVLFLALYLPPFKARPLLFTCLIVATVMATAASEWPRDRIKRYALGGSWIWYFPVLEKLLLHQPRGPEHDCWRLDRVPHEAEVAIAPFSWAKARWAAALLVACRGVGWSHGSRRLPPAPRDEDGRTRFVLRHLGDVLVGNLVVEATTLLAAAIDIPRVWSLAALPGIMVCELLMGATVWGSWTFQYGFVAVFGVGLGLSRPRDWPPIFGSLASASSVAGFWGSYWHGILRQPALGFSHFFIECLGIPKRTRLAHACHLLTAFGFSTVFHVVSLYPIIDGYISVPRLCADITLFFMAQVVAIMAETTVATWWSTRTASGSATFERERETNSQPVSLSPERPSVPWLGYVWVLVWLGLSSWSFVRVYVAVGTMEWKVPLRILEPLIERLS